MFTDSLFVVLAELLYGVSFKPIAAHMLKTVLTSLLIIICLKLQSQTYSYTNYSIREGLAGSNVYAATQDKEGFMWFATETGVSRFDGVHFKNYTIDDGLPDNEILGFHADSKGRLWMLPFRKTICYYYKGKIYNQQNDPLLKSLKITNHIFGIVENEKDGVAFMEASAIHMIKDTNIRTIRIFGNDTYFSAIGINEDGNITVHRNTGIYYVAGDSLKIVNPKITEYFMGQVFIGPSYLAVGTKKNLELIFYKTGEKVSLGPTPQHINFSNLPDGFFSDNTRDGALIYNSNDLSFKNYHLPGKSVVNVFRDSESNLWFCTQREGIFKLNSPYVSNSVFTNNSGKILAVHSILKHNNHVLVGAEEASLFKIIPSIEKIRFEAFFPGVQTQILALLETKKKELLMGFPNSIISSTGRLHAQGAIKDFSNAYGDTILLSTSAGVWLVNGHIRDSQIISMNDAIWSTRATTSHYSQDTFYIGTLDGLYKLSRQTKAVKFAGDESPLLKTRIASIKETQDGVLWIATYDRGIVAYKNCKILANITRESGLSSNICRKLYLHRNTLWVGTDNGVNKVVINGNKYAITKYSVADGLLSNFINAIYVDDSLVYVGTPEGVSYFDDKKISQQAPCVLRLTNFAVSGNSLSTESRSFSLSRRNNNIRFEYSGISYRSGGEIFYRYKLAGLDTGWHTTTNNFLSYPTLLPNNYVMEIQAINKFGVESDIISIPFIIEQFWWEKTWVKLSAIFLVLLLGGIIMNRRIKQVRSREKEKNRLREQISSLEQMALKAQMNPHFIFNSLNSLHHYVLDKDVVGANKYISGFAKLIRLTLDNSSKPEIPIEEELEYITQYLELEKARSGNKFNYSIHIPDHVLHDGYSISPMILQPFVENSIRHGIKYRNDSDGHIKIDIQALEKGLQYVIEDNGVGRLVAGQYKGINPVQYQSKGISLTKQRIALMNKNRKEKIEVFIMDLEENGAVAGTRVLIYFPYTNHKL